MAIEITAHARLHFGFLDLSRDAQRRFGGIGLSITRPRVRLRLEAQGGALEVQGEQAERVKRLAERFYRETGLSPGAAVRVEEAIPEHIGLGSGTQTALAVGAALASLHGLELPPARLATIMGRARRSGIGHHTFQRGGFVVEGGHKEAGDTERTDGPPPLLVRHEFPEEWRILLALPEATRTISGAEEEAAFLRLPPAAENSAGALARMVLMRLLPALVERDLPAFGAALADAQDLVGSCFAAVQEGAFHPAGARLACALREAGARGVGQSSWGPAVYAFAADEREEIRLGTIARRTDPGAVLLDVRGENREAAMKRL